MGKFLLKRLYLTILVMLAVSIIAFGLIRLIPGDPAYVILGVNATDELVAEARVAMGLDKPIYVQYLIYLKNMLQGDFGMSTTFNQPCINIIRPRIAGTMSLAFAAFILSFVLSIPLGIIAGIKKGAFADLFATFFALLGNACSPVWVGSVLILIFAGKLKWLPTQGYGTLKSIILPAFTLGLAMSASIVRQLRSGMYETLQEDYITATRARGVPRLNIYGKYALKNAMMPVITVIGINIAHMLAGSAVVETVFGWPGLGSLLITAINNRDYSLLQVCILASCAIFVFANLILDIMYGVVDPRAKFE